MTDDIGPLTKVGFKAIEKTMTALNAAAETTGLSKTDTLNQSVQIYAYLLAARSAGDRLLLLHTDGQIEEVTFK